MNIGELLKAWAALKIKIFKRFQHQLAWKNLKFLAVCEVPFFKLLKKSKTHQPQRNFYNKKGPLPLSLEHISYVNL